jgi:myo-inositol-1(or 4)-monophosphatase
MPPAQPPPDDPELPAALRRIAEQAARIGGQVARSYFGRVSAARLKPDRSEVCEADDAAQAAILAAIRAQRPEDAFIAEETVQLAGGASLPPAANDRVCWVIDPLDGTRNFLRGIPFYACSVAAMLGGRPVSGAIYDPVRDLLYSGSAAEGVLIDGTCAADHPLAGCPRAPNPKPIVGIPSSPAGHAATIVQRWLDRFVCRSLGSTALQTAWVATGQLDAALSDNARLWDIAAGALLVTASGGAISSPQGAPLFPLDVGRYAGEELPALAIRAGWREHQLP